MKHRLLSFFAIALAWLCGVQSSDAQGLLMTFSCDTGHGITGSRGNVGNAIKQDYDVAVHIDGSRFGGMTIESIRVPMYSMTGLSDLKVWLTSKLDLQTVNGKKTNVPDICSQDAQVGGDWVEVKLAQPYTIPSEGVYMGYSFQMDSLTESNARPLRITTEVHDGGMYIHSSRSYRSWTDVSADCSSTLEALLSGAPAAAVSVTAEGAYFGATGKTTNATFILENHGASGISNVGYTYTYNGEQYSETAYLDNPVAPTYGASSYVTFTLPSVADKGYYPVDLTITTVNGLENTDAARHLTQDISVFDRVPKHRSVVEEYSGTWCGFCPRGFAGLEVMHRLYPDDFIGISYHSSGGQSSEPMEVLSGSQFPNQIDGFPAAYVDRLYYTNAYCGYNDQQTQFGLDQVWLAACDVLAEADIDVNAHLSDDLSTAEATATVTFPLAISKANYEVEFILLADSLTGTGNEWTQVNYYARGAYGTTFDQPEMEQFYKAQGNVAGLKFNDVLVATTRTEGGDVQLPAEIEADKAYESTISFPLSKLANSEGKPVIQDKNNLRVVALLLNTRTGAIVNAAQTGHLRTTAGIATAQTTKADAPATQVYDLSGRRLSQPVRGINIMRTADGRVTKVLR